MQTLVTELGSFDGVAHLTVLVDDVKQVRLSASAYDARRRRVVLLRPLEERDRGLRKLRGTFVSALNRRPQPRSDDRPFSGVLRVRVLHVERLHGCS